MVTTHLHKLPLFQLSDIQPTDWAFKHCNLGRALRLAAGYPDGTYRGNRALTRYTNLRVNACLDRDELTQSLPQVTW